MKPVYKIRRKSDGKFFQKWFYGTPQFNNLGKVCLRRSFNKV